MASNLVATTGESDAFPAHKDYAQQPPIPQDYTDHRGLPPGAQAPHTPGMPVPEPAGAPPAYTESTGELALPHSSAGSSLAPPPTNDTTSTNSAYSTVFSSVSTGVDLNTTAPSDKDLEIPAVMFGIPFPTALSLRPSSPSSPSFGDDDDPKRAAKAAKQAEKAAKKEAKKEAKRPALLLYAPPRAPYRKPPPTEDGKPGKQKLVKRVERAWQEEVAVAHRIHNGEVPDASRWKKMKAPLARKADQLIQWLPDSTMGALQRIPPKKRLKEAIVFVPTDPEFGSPEKQAELERQLQAERKGAIKRTWISGLLLPVTETIDFFNPVPLFAFEVNLAYFAYQLQGLRKATALTSDDVSLTLEPNPHLEPLRARLAALCNAAQQKKFPDLNKEGSAPVPVTSDESFGTDVPAQPHGLRAPDVQVTAPTPDGTEQHQLGAEHGPASESDIDTDDETVWDTSVPGGAPPEGRAGGRALAEAIVTAFRAAVPPEVAARHALDDLDALALDIERCLRKGVKEYLKTV